MQSPFYLIMSVLGLLVHLSSFLSTYISQLYSGLKLSARTGALKQIAVRSCYLTRTLVHGGTREWAFEGPRRYKTISREER